MIKYKTKEIGLTVLFIRDFQNMDFWILLTLECTYFIEIKGNKQKV